MRRILPVVLALSLIGRSQLEGQSCRGLAPLSRSVVQLSGGASLTAESTSLDGGVAYGLAQGAFGQAKIATRSYQMFGKSSLGLAAALGYQIALGDPSRLQLCPIGALGWEIGPNNAFDSGVKRSRRSAQVGLAVGTFLSAIHRWEIRPSFAVSYAYQRDQARDNAGATLFRIADHYALAQVGVGFILNSTVSLRPYVDLPLWLEGSEPTVGVTLAYNF